MTDISSFFTDDGRVDARLLADGREPKIDAATCATVRERVRNGQTLRAAAASVGVAHSTIGHHVRGECNHDHGTPAVERGGDA